MYLTTTTKGNDRYTLYIGEILEDFADFINEAKGFNFLNKSVVSSGSRRATSIDLLNISEP